MPKISIYVPDALALKLRNAETMNVSAVCRRALIRELEQRNPQENDLVFLLARIEADVAAVRGQIVTDALEASEHVIAAR